jgi:hypothetical protein
MYKLFAKWILATLILGGLNSAYALTSTGADGAFSLNNSLTLNASNNQTFNYTTFDLQSGGILDFSGLTRSDSIFILATGDIYLNGILNLYSNLTFETTGNVFVNGTVEIGSSTFQLSATTINFGSSSILNANGGGSINFVSGNSADNNQNPPGYGDVCISIRGLSCNDYPPTKDITIGNGGLVNISPGATISITSPVPEPSNHTLLLAGIGLFYLRRTKITKITSNKK